MPDTATEIDNETLIEAPGAPELSSSPAESNDAGTDTVDLSGFLEMGLPADLPESPTAAPARTEKPAAENKTTTKPAQAPPVATPTSKPPGQPVAGRAEKLAKVAPHVRPLLERMSNDAFNHFYDIQMQLDSGKLVPKEKADAELAKVRDELTADLSKARYYDHEDGYKLTDEYKTISATTENLEGEAQFWADQYENVSKGQPWHVLQQTADGTIRISAPRDPKEAGAIGMVQSKLTQAQLLHAQYKDKLQQLPTAHKSEYSKYSGFFNTLSENLFGKLTDPKAPTYNKGFVDRAEKHLQAWPAMFRGRPEVRALAHAMVTGELLVAQNQQLQAELAKTQNHKKAILAGSPDPGAVTAGITSATASDDDAIDQLDRMAGSRY